MKFKNVRDFIKKINKDRIIQVSAVCIGTMLITSVAHDTNVQKEPKDIYFYRMVGTDLDLYNNRKETWSVNWNELLGYDKKKIRNYDNSNINYKENEMFFQKELENSVNTAIVRTVIRGEYGNGEERKKRLEEAGYDYEKIQSLVNEWYDKQESYQYIYPIVDDTFTLSINGELVKSGYTITYIDVNGDKQTSYYDNNGNLLSTSEDYKNSR